MEKLSKNNKDKGISVPGIKSIKALGGMMLIIMFLAVSGFVAAVTYTATDLTTQKSIPIEVPASNINVKNNDLFLSGLDVNQNKIGSESAKQIKFESVQPSIRIKNPSVATVLANDLPPVFLSIAVFIIAWRLYETSKRMKKGSVLSKETIKDVRVITVASSIALIVYGIAPTVLTESLFAEKGFEIYNSKVSSLNIGFLFVGVVIALIGELLDRVLKDVVILKEEADATI